MNTQTNDGGPVFPRILGGSTIEDGLSIRDWFAGMALQGLLSNPGGPIQANGMSGWSFTNCTLKQVVDLALEIADTTIEARNETKQ